MIDWTSFFTAMAMMAGGWIALICAIVFAEYARLRDMVGYFFALAAMYLGAILVGALL